ERIDRNTGARNRAFVDKVIQLFGNLQATGLDTVSHDISLNASVLESGNRSGAVARKGARFYMKRRQSPNPHARLRERLFSIEKGHFDQGGLYSDYVLGIK